MARFGRRRAAQQEAEAFRAVRRVARDDVLAVVAVAPQHDAVVAARAAYDRASTLADLGALEPVVHGAWLACGLGADQRRRVLVGDRWLPWAELGSYAAVAEAARSI